MSWERIRSRWATASAANGALGGDSSALIVEPPASEEEVLALEGELGFALPHALRDALLSFSRRVEVRWFLPDDFELSAAFAEIFGGGCHWSLEGIAQFNADKDSWVEECFPNADDSYDVVWHGKLAFQEVGNGDSLALELAGDRAGSVVYLSHDDGEGHGYLLGRDFQDFQERWSRLACVGAEDSQWLPFTEDAEKGLLPDHANAIAWRKVFGLSD